MEVRPARGQADPHAEAAAHAAAQEGLSLDQAHSAHVYLIEAPLTDAQTAGVAEELLADPVNQSAALGAAPTPENAVTIEVHYLPGVMDPVAQSACDAIAEMLPDLPADAIDARTAVRYDLSFGGGAADRPSDEALRAFAEQHLGNTVIQSIHLSPYHPEAFEHGHVHPFNLTHVPIRELNDDALLKMSRESHLFLSLDEMKAIQDYYREANREPTDIELETLAQTWSEHCVHKTLKSTIHYTVSGTSVPVSQDPIFQDKPHHTLNDDGSVTIHNLLKSTVAAATFKLKEDPRYRDWLVSVFDDNAGIVKLDGEHGIAIKVETHNHPSAIEPYGGAATGIGGCIRDIMGTGLAALPIANTDTFCVAPPLGKADDLPKGVIHPRRILQRVVDGVRDYGNRMGIPTVNGAVYFHDDFLGNPLVFAGCVGLIPLDKCFGTPNPGDKIVILGGRTGRDGIHGATFSSAELTDAHADEFSHAVQIGNAITQKKTLDVIMQARDHAPSGGGCLFTAISDCGAGGFSSAVGEMGEKVGAHVELANAPLKYAGLTYTEVWISEAQERMPLAVPPENVDTLRALCEAEDVEMCILGTFGYVEDGVPTLKLDYHGTQVGKLAMPFLHDGIPTPVRKAEWNAEEPISPGRHASANRSSSLIETLTTLLSHPNIASKHWIIRQYDHEVQGGSVVKPLVGPQQDGPSDASVIRPKFDASRGIALAVGLQPGLSEKSRQDGLALDGDSYHATLAAIDEAVRNVVCVGAAPDLPTGGIAILDNFCWPNCDDPKMLGSLVRAAEGCYDGALAYGTPFVSGKDSLSNQFTTEDGKLITIPQTLLITALGIVEDVRRCVTMDAKQPGHALLIVGQTTPHLGGSHLAACGFAQPSSPLYIPKVDLKQGPANARAVASLIQQGLVAAAHDCSDGGMLVAAAEMAFAGRVGLDLDLANLPTTEPLPHEAACFAETPSRYLLEVAPENLDLVIRSLRESNTPFAQIGTFATHHRLTLRTPTDGQRLDANLDDLRQAWLKPLDW
ncbi:MAG: phosphoribosylformylglycinamidine synthase [Planctomycetes bacterium]|nr:phosphoribosylformylglycinamidine synthase [Planctomycetota bacterium]